MRKREKERGNGRGNGRRERGDGEGVVGKEGYGEGEETETGPSTQGLYNVTFFVSTPIAFHIAAISLEASEKDICTGSYTQSH